MSSSKENSNNQCGFSLTIQLLHLTNQWHQQGYVGSLIGRTVNLLATPLTSAIDAIAHLIFPRVADFIYFIPPKARGFTSLQWISNKLNNLDNTWHHTRSSTEESANASRFFSHLLAIVALPILGFISPKRAFDWTTLVNNRINRSIPPSFRTRFEVSTFHSKDESYNFAQTNLKEIQKNHHQIYQVCSPCPMDLAGNEIIVKPWAHSLKYLRSITANPANYWARAPEDIHESTTFLEIVNNYRDLLLRLNSLHEDLLKQENKDQVMFTAMISTLPVQMVVEDYVSQYLGPLIALIVKEKNRILNEEITWPLCREVYLARTCPTSKFNSIPPEVCNLIMSHMI